MNSKKQQKAAQDKTYYEANREKRLAQFKARYEANREKHLAQVKANYEANREKRLAYAKAYREANREKCAARATAYYEANKDEVSSQQKVWRRSNPDKVTAKCARRRAKKLQATPPWMTKEDFAAVGEWYQIAKDLQWLSEEPLHVDHIVPLQGKETCGLHVPWNLQVLPANMNLSKGNKIC